MTNVEDRVERALHVLAERIEPDVAAARARLGSRAGSTAPPARRVLRPQLLGDARRGDGGARRCRLAVGGRHASGAAGRADGPGLARPIRPTISADTVPSTPSSSSSVEPPTTVVDTAPRHPDTRATRRARPPARRGPDPFRPRPRLGARDDDVGPASVVHPSIRRWHSDRRCVRERIGGDGVGHTFDDAPSAGIAGVDARIVVTPAGAEVGWLSEDGVRVVAGVGDVDVDETIAVARSAVSADQLADVAVPEGFEEVAVPVDQGTVRYEDTMVTIGFSTVRRGGEVDAAAAAFMTAGRDGPISPLPGEDAWVTTTFDGHPTAVVAVGTDGIATIVGLPGTDVASLVSSWPSSRPETSPSPTRRRPTASPPTPSRRTARSIAADGSSTSTRPPTGTTASASTPRGAAAVAAPLPARASAPSPT